MTSVGDILRVMEKIAPSFLAEDWDNSGLQIGQHDRQVKKICVALDPLPDVISDACNRQADLLITHHPLLFSPLKRIDLASPVGKMIEMAIQHHLTILSAHTNLDSAVGGINDILAQIIGLKTISVLTHPAQSRNVKLAVYVPSDYEDKVLNALFETDAGKIGEYSCCSFRNPGTGTFLPSEKSDPFIGKRGEIAHVSEIRIEAVVPKAGLERTIRHIRAAHPYQTMAYDVYPWIAHEDVIQGLGRIGSLDTEMTLADLARQVKNKLDPRFIKMVGNPSMPIRKAALCSGSGSSLMKDFLASDAQVYITGDLRYHDARDAQAKGKALIDIGHFCSEHIIVNALADTLRSVLTDIEIETCKIESDPFLTV